MFTAEADVTPSASNIDAGISLADGTQNSWDHLAATVLFYTDGCIAANGGTLSVYRVSKPWVEAQVTWNVYATGNNWTAAGMQAGTDYQTSPVVSITIHTTPNIWRDFDVTALVQSWVSGAAANHGFVVRSPTNGVKPLFYSSGYSVGPTLRPKLTVTY